MVLSDYVLLHMDVTFRTLIELVQMVTINAQDYTDLEEWFMWYLNFTMPSTSHHVFR